VIELQGPVRSATGGVSAEAPFNAFMGDNMSKPFLTYEQQIDKLKNDKNLIIKDETYAIEKLKQIGYFKLISGYKHLFKNKTTKKYNDSVCFEDVFNLYCFDETLREINLRYLLKAEQQLKSMISYYFCEKYGDSQLAYLEKTNYNYTSCKNKNDIEKLVRILENYVTKETDYHYINHTKNKHKNLPLWVLINALTFGNISKMYSLLPQNLQICISKNYEFLNEKQLGQITKVLTKFRNACAHGERLFSYKTVDSIPDLLIHKKLNIPQKGNEYIYGKKDLYAVVISLKYLLTNDLFKEYKRDLLALINPYVKTSSISEKEFLNEMGFPENWNTISRFRKL